MMRVEVSDVTDELAVAWRPGARGPARTTLRAGPARPSSRRTPRRPGPPAGCGPSRRCGSRAASRGSASTPTTARSPTRSAGSAPPCTWTRAATAARRPSPACTPSAGRRAGSPCCTSTAPRTGSRRSGAELVLGREGGRLRRHLAPATTSSARSRWRWSSATSPLDAAARGRRPAGRPGGPRRPRGRAARAPDPSVSWLRTTRRRSCSRSTSSSWWSCCSPRPPSGSGRGAVGRSSCSRPRPASGRHPYAQLEVVMNAVIVAPVTFLASLLRPRTAGGTGRPGVRRVQRRRGGAGAAAPGPARVLQRRGGEHPRRAGRRRARPVGAAPRPLGVTWRIPRWVERPPRRLHWAHPDEKGLPPWCWSPRSGPGARGTSST